MTEPRMPYGTPFPPASNETTDSARAPLDPDVAVEKQLLLATGILDDANADVTAEEDGEGLAELVVALDAHLVAGGAPPKRWTEARSLPPEKANSAYAVGRNLGACILHNPSVDGVLRDFLAKIDQTARDIWKPGLALVRIQGLLAGLPEAVAVAESQAFVTLRNLLDAETEFTEFDAELTASEQAGHEDGPPDSLIEEHADAQRRRDKARALARDLINEHDKEKV